MRVPPQRSSRSNTATTSGGKRLSSPSISVSNSAASSSKKRKLQSEAPPGNKPAQKAICAGEAATSNPISKRKQTLPNIKKPLHHPKKTDAVLITKAPKSDLTAKKSQPKKCSNVPLMGLKKIKVKDGRVTIKEILVTAAASKPPKKLVKSVSTKKQISSNTNSKKAASAGESLLTPATTADQILCRPGSNCGKHQTEAEDQLSASQKKAQCKSNVSSKPNTKKGKTVIKKTKNTALISVPAPLTRTKKLEQRQKLKSVKKIYLKQYPIARHVIVTQVQQRVATGGKKKIPTKRKYIAGENIVQNFGTPTHVTRKASESPVRESHATNKASESQSFESQLSGSADKVDPSNFVTPTTTEAPEKSGKAKDEDCAIKKSDKKKAVKKKPKIEDVRKRNEALTEDKSSEVSSEATKDKSETSVRKKEGKGDNKEHVIPKVKCVKKKNKPKCTEALTSKQKCTKQTVVLKPVKIIPKKVNKITTPKVSSNPKVGRKLKNPKKKTSKSAIKNAVSKDHLSAEPVMEARRQEEPKLQKDDDDSSTSDEITLDVLLLRQQQLKQESSVGDEPSSEQRNKSEGIVRSPSSPIDTVKLADTQNLEIKPPLPLITSVKVEAPVPNPVVPTLSPSVANTSDDEDLRSIKNRIKVKLEENSADFDKQKLSAQTETNAKKKAVAGKVKGDDSCTNRWKGGGVNVKNEPKEETGRAEQKRGESDGKVSSDNHGKEKVKKILGVRRSRTDGGKNGGSGSDTEQRARRMKLFGFWSGPKRHRVASLNALAKVHCLYENESRGALLGICGTNGGNNQRAPKPPQSSENGTVSTTRTLRSAPGLRGVGKHWDMHNASSTSSSSPSSDDNESNSDSCVSSPTVPVVSYKQKRRQQKVAAAGCTIKKKSKQVKNMKKVVKRRRNRCELMMDLKDMVVRKRMASLNASAILAASYSVEKRAVKSVKDDGVSVGASNIHQIKKETKKRLVTKKVVEVEDDSSISSDIEIEECDVEGRGSSRSVIEVRTTPSGGPNSNKKVAVIVNQDTDVTITGVYVNSTTRSTHHEGFCSIAGLQYRISSTSHTQTEATAVATETVLHTTTAAEHPPSQHHPAEPPLAPPMKSYTPLGALSNMQPPGATVVGGPPPPHHHHHPHAHAHPHAHPPPCNVPPQQPPPHRGGPINPGGVPVHPPISPLGRRHGCSSAFSAPPPPPNAGYGPPPQHSQPPPHHHPHPTPQGQQDPAYIHGYYQPAGPLISTHHHHHSSSSSSSSSNTGKVPPAVLPTLEASPNPTPPPSATGHSGPGSVPTATTTAVVPPAPQQIVSATSSGSGGGGTRSGGDESDNDVIITATSCSGGGEVAPPPPVPQPLQLQQHPHQTGYRYAQPYPPPPTPSTPQHIHHQSYTYNYPHTQYYPSPPASASIQYSAVATNPPSLQQHHTHYHNQDLCYSATANYPPASYFHHKSYSTPPPSGYHRRYIPPPHQYYTSDLYTSPASNASQNSGQSQQSQQMVVTGTSAGSASSYQPPGAPPPPLVGVSTNPPPLVDTYPPPVSIVDPYPPPPGYYTGYSTGPGAGGCYTHSPPTRSLFIGSFADAAYQSCPCPMQSCPKNVHTGPLTGDGKGPHITTKQQQQPVQESGASFHQLPLPPVALALPLEPPGALGPPSPARGSAGMPPPPSPATASVRNHSQTQEEAAFQQRGWELGAAGTEPQSKLEASKQEPMGQVSVGETKLTSTLEGAQDLRSKPDTEFGSDTTTIPSEGAVGNTDISRHRLLAISKTVANPDMLGCRTKARKKSPPVLNNTPLLMCKLEVPKERHNSSEVVLTKPEDKKTVVDPKAVRNSVKTEVRNLEKEVCIENNKSTGLSHNGGKVMCRDISSRKRNFQPANSCATKAETEISVPKRHKLSTSNVDISRLSVSHKESQKSNNRASEPQDKVNGVPTETQEKCRNGQKSQPLSSNICSLHKMKHNARKRKLDDAKDLTENKEPVTVTSKKKRENKVKRSETKIYPSRVKQVKKVTDSEAMKRIDAVLDSVVSKGRIMLEPLVTTRRSTSSNVTPVTKRTSGSKSVEHKKLASKINGVFSHQRKLSLRHQGGKEQKDSSSCWNGAVSRVHVSQTNANRVRVQGKNVLQRRKSEDISVSVEAACTNRKRARVSHILRSYGLRDSLSDLSSGDDTDTNASRGKVSSCPSSVAGVRRTSTGNRKDQSKKSASLVVRNDGVSTLKKQVPQQQDVTVAAITAVCRKSGPKKLLQVPKWSNGWKFEGVPFESKVFVSSDDELKPRKCYPLMRHEEGDVICPRDCVLLKSGPRKMDLPFVAKVAALWENPDDGEMMVSLLWYYRPEHTDHGRRPGDMEDEIFASKHKDINSVACIEDKCYVLTFNEYCRYRKCVRRLEDGVREPCLVVPQHEEYPREKRQPPGCVAPELVFFCRRVYDFRQRRILKNPG